MDIIIIVKIREEELSKLISFCCVSHLDTFFYLMDLCAVKLGNENSPVCCGRSEEVGFADEYQLLETNCFSCSNCCFAKGSGHRSR